MLDPKGSWGRHDFGHSIGSLILISIVVSGEVSMLWVGDFEGIYLLMEKLRGSLPTSSLIDKYEVEPNARAV